MDDAVDYYLRKLDEGDLENAFFGLIDMPHSIVPKLIEAFYSEGDPNVRAVLVEVIWQHRLPTSLEFLAEALRDDSADVWKTALDGIVALAGPKSIEVLEAERVRLLTGGQRDARLRIGWIDEAIEQIKMRDL
jgi:hypothetical protein